MIKILFFLLKLDEEAVEKVIFVITSVVIGLFANIVAAAIMKFFLKW